MKGTNFSDPHLWSFRLSVGSSSFEMQCGSIKIENPDVVLGFQKLVRKIWSSIFKSYRPSNMDVVLAWFCLSLFVALLFLAKRRSADTHLNLCCVGLEDYCLILLIMWAEKRICRIVDSTVWKVLRHEFFYLDTSAAFSLYLVFYLLICTGSDNMQKQLIVS